MANVTVTQTENVITANTTTNVIEVTQQETNVVISSRTVSDINLGNIVTPIQSNSNITTTANVTAAFLHGDGSNITGLTTDMVTEGSNLYYTQARFDSSFAAKTTTDLTEGTNLYYTSDRANSNVTQHFADGVTTDIVTTGDISTTANVSAGILQGSNVDVNNVVALNDIVSFGNANISLDISGNNLNITNNIDSSGHLTAGSGDISQNLTVGSLTVEGQANITYQDLDVNGNLEVFDNTLLRSNLEVMGYHMSLGTPAGGTGNSYVYIDAVDGVDLPLLEWANASNGANSEFGSWTIGKGRFNLDPLNAGGFTWYEGNNTLQPHNLSLTGSMDALLVEGNAVITGNLQVQGNVDYVNVEDLLVKDSSITLAVGAPTATSANIIIDRSGTGGGINAYIKWDEVSNNWKFFDGSSIRDMPRSTTELAEGINLYYTQGRFDTAFSAKDTDDLSEGTTNKYYSTTLFNADFATKTTSDLTEGANLYYTDARSRAAISASGNITYDANTGVIGESLTTTDIDEGDNLYYTDARFDTRFATKTTTDLTEGANLYYTTDRANSAISAYTGSMENLTGNITTTANIQAEYFIANNEFLGDLDGAISTAVFNDTATTLTKGKAVYLTGGNQGDQPHVDLADNTNASHMPALGIVKENIGASSEGQVVTSGVMNFSSHGFTQGADLYVNGSGDLTTTIPTGESELIQKIGKVVSQNHIIVQGAFRTNATPNLDEGNIFLGSTSNSAIAVAPDSNFDTTGNTFSLSNALSDVNKIDSETDTALTLFGEGGIELNQKVDSTESRVIDLTTDGYRVAFADAGNANVASYTGGVKQLLIGATVTAGSAVVSCFPLQFLGAGYPAGIYVAGQTGLGAYLDLTAGFTYQSVQACLANAAVCGGVQNGAGWKIYNSAFASFVSQFTGNAYVQSVTGNDITMSEPAHTSGTTAYVLFPGAHSSNNNTPFIMKSTAESSGYTTFNFDGLRPFGMYFDNPETLANATMDYVSVSDNFDLANVQMQQRADINAGNDSALRTNRLLLIGESANPDFVSSSANASVPSETSALGVTVEHDGLTDWQNANTTPVTKFLINTFQGNTLQDGNVLPTWAEPFSSGVHDKDMEYVSAPSFNFKIANNNKDSSLADQRMTGDVVVGKLSWNYLSNAAPVYNMGVDSLTSPASILAKIPSSHANTSRIADLDMYLQSTYATSYRNGANVDAGSIPRTFLASQSGNTVISAKTDGKIMLKPVRDYGDDGSTGNASYSLNRYSDELHDYHTFLSAEFANTSAKTGTIVTIQDASGSTNGDTNGFNYDSKGNATLRLQTHLANSDARYNFDIIHDESSENLVIASDPSANTEHIRIESSGRVNIKQVMKLHPLSNSAILALVGNEVGDMVYGSDANRVCYYDGTNWVTIDTNTAIV